MEHEETTSKFNAAIAKLQRIDDIKKGAINARLNKDYRFWRDCLMAWRSEINERFKPDHKVKADTYELLISDSLCPKLDNTIIPFGNYKPTVNYNSVFLLLNKYEMLLGELEYKFGLSLVDKDEDEDAL